MNVLDLRDECQRLIDDGEIETEIAVSIGGSIGGRSAPVQRSLFTRDENFSTLALIVDPLDATLELRVPTFDDVREIVREEIQNFASLIVNEVVRGARVPKDPGVEEVRG